MIPVLEKRCRGGWLTRSPQSFCATRCHNCLCYDGDVRILIAPDKFKGSLDASEVAQNIAAGLRDVLPNVTIVTMPVADGGEGTAAVIAEVCDGERITCPAHDALGRAIEADYFWLRDRETAVMEMSATAGLWRIAPNERDLPGANTFGVGEMMRHAAQSNPKEILIGLGGSATNDGGFGMARALGYRFLKGDGELRNTADLADLDRIVTPNERLRVKIVAAV